MNRLTYMSIIIGLIFISCTNSNPNNQNTTSQNGDQNEVNPYLSKYAGGYQIEVQGYNSQTDMEAYALHNSGNAKWMFIIAQPNGQAKLTSEKSGTWTATANKITITINGKTGPIIEEYNLINGKFTSGDRSLKRTD